MDKLNKCPKCNSYTLKDKCTSCNSKTESAHYKFIQLANKEEKED